MSQLAQTKPISYMKANAAKLKQELGYNPLFVTQNGEETLVVQTSEAYHLMEEKLAYMQLILNSKKSMESTPARKLDDVLNTL